MWRQIVADVLGIPVVSVNTGDEGASYGAAIVAAVGVGAFDSIEEACDATVHETAVTQPQRAYDAEFERYRRLYAAARSMI